MKTKILFCLLFSVNLINSQIYKPEKKEKPPKELKTKVVTYDFKGGNFLYDTTDYIKHNQPIVLKIININRITYQTSISGNDVRIVDENLSDSLKKVKNFVNDNISMAILGDDPNLTFESQSIKAKIKKATNTGRNNVIPKAEKKIEEKEKTLSELRGHLKAAENKKQILTTKLMSFKVDSVNADKQFLDPLQEQNRKEVSTKKYALLDSINSIKTKIALKNKEIEGIKDKISPISREISEKEIWEKRYNDLIEQIQEKYQNFTNNIQNMQNIISAYGNYLDFIKNPMMNKDLYIRERGKYAILKKQEEYYGNVKTFTESYNKINDRLNSNDLTEVLAKLKENDQSKYDLANVYISQLKKYVEDTYAKLKPDRINSLINNTQISDAVLKTDEPYQFFSNPIQSMEDMIEFNVKIKKDNETSLVKNFTYTEYVQGGVRWDFSVGAVFDFFTNRQTYDLQEVAGNNKVKIVENNRNVFYPSLAGILHTSFRNGGSVAWALSLGASLDISQFRLNSFFPGVSLMLGKREKTVITVGPSFSNVTQLKKYYKSDDTATYDNTLDVNSITTNNFKIGAFVGLTYNLTSKQRTKIKIL